MGNTRSEQCGGKCTETGYRFDEGTMCLASSPTPGPVGMPQSSDFLHAKRFMTEVAQAVDAVEELRGAGIVLELPGHPPLLLRQSSHASGLETYVQVPLVLEAPVDGRTWWQRWSGVVLNCGATALGGVATVVSCGATPLTAGASTPVCIASIVGTSATAAQCGLSVATETWPEFREYVKSDDGQWMNYVDLGLDLLSLGVGVASLPGVIKSGANLAKTAKYAKYLNNADPSKLAKVLAKLEQVHKDLGSLRTWLDKGLKLANPAGKTELTKNILKRMLPQVMKQLRRSQLEFLSSSISFSLSVLSSNSGGVGSKEYGLVKLGRIGIYQFVNPE